MSKPFLDVAVGLLTRHDGQILLNQRPQGKPWAGWWELPGGKLEPGETPRQALDRELHEELGIQVTQATPWITTIYEYPKTRVQLRFHRVLAWEGVVTPLENQKLAWVPPHDPIPLTPLLPASLAPLRWASLPDRYLITAIRKTENLPAYLDALQGALQKGVRLVQFREPAWMAAGASTATVFRAFEQVVKHCHEYGAACLLNSVHPASWRRYADGVHYRAQDAAAALQVADTSTTQHSDNTTRWPGAQRDSGYLSVSVHDSEQLQIARALQADFVVIGHVLPTPSHPTEAPLGWDRFQALAEAAGLPAFALGGQDLSTLACAWDHGAHGIAGIRGPLA